MYALIVPVSVPFILLGTVLGLSWWEDYLLPPAVPADPVAGDAVAAVASQSGPAAPTVLMPPVVLPQPITPEAPLAPLVTLTRQVAGR
jgi:hypothetical protein